MDLHLLLLSFGLVFPVELPDKTFIAALVLSTRYSAMAVWVGVGLAFGVQCVVAVTAGRAVSFLPDWVVHSVSITMFVIGAYILLRGAAVADAGTQQQADAFAARIPDDRTGVKAATASFLVLFAAEWGDLSQLLMLNLVAKYGSPGSVFVGSWAALLAVSGLAVLAGQVLLRHLRLSLLHYVAAAICLLLAGAGVVSLVASIRGSS